MKDWINLYVNQTGTVTSSSTSFGSDRLVIGQRTIELKETKSGGFLGIGETTHDTVSILEVDRSGALIIEYSEGTVAYGDVEVYLVLERGPREARYLSAPVHEELAVKNLTRLQLVILASAGPVGARYHALCNAHCIFETKMDVSFESDPWREAVDWPGW
jgi:hypothetical protein